MVLVEGIVAIVTAGISLVGVVLHTVDKYRERRKLKKLYSEVNDTIKKAKEEIRRKRMSNKNNHARELEQRVALIEDNTLSEINTLLNEVRRYEEDLERWKKQEYLKMKPEEIASQELKVASERLNKTQEMFMNKHKEPQQQEEEENNGGLQRLLSKLDSNKKRINKALNTPSV